MATAVPYDGVCDIPVAFWDSSIRTRFFPSVIVFTLAVGWYYLNGLFHQGGTVALYALVPFAFIMGLAGTQAYVIFKQPQCPKVPLTGIAVAFAIGIAAGSIGYWSAFAATGGPMGKSNLTPVVVTRQEFTTENFNDVTKSFIFNDNTLASSANASGSGSAPTDATTPSNVAKCSAQSDQVFQVDLYKNGKLVTQAIGE